MEREKQEGGGGSEGGGGTRRPRRAEAPGASWLRAARLRRLLLAPAICGRSSARPALCRPWLLSGSIFSSVSDGVLFLTSFTRARSDDSFSNLPSEQTLPALRYLFIFFVTGIGHAALVLFALFFFCGGALLFFSSPPSYPPPAAAAAASAACASAEPETRRVYGQQYHCKL